ncbi:MAG: hypothetical protein II304_03910 [Bacteroidales bacterium]|jgi:hypothetical protein|nr:hypothetical protein [Bacteroidales bacterium]
MSWCSIESHWRCPNCQYDNSYFKNWNEYFKFKEVEDVFYSKETCKQCNSEFYVAECEPQLLCFPSLRKPGASLCKNDYIKNLVLNIDLPLTCELKQYWS